MPNVTDPKYIYQGTPMLSIEQATEIKALAMFQGESMSVVQRTLIELGLRALYASLVAWPNGWKPGRPTAAMVEQARKEMEVYARSQLERRRQSSRNTLARRRAAERGDVAQEAPSSLEELRKAAREGTSQTLSEA